MLLTVKCVCVFVCICVCVEQLYKLSFVNKREEMHCVLQGQMYKVGVQIKRGGGGGLVIYSQLSMQIA